MLLEKLPPELRGNIYDYCCPGADLFVLKEHSKRIDGDFFDELQRVISLAQISRETRNDVFAYLFRNRKILIKWRDIKWFTSFTDRNALRYIRHLHIFELSSSLWSKEKRLLDGLAYLATINQETKGIKHLTLSQHPWRIWHFPSSIDYEGDLVQEARSMLSLPFVVNIRSFGQLDYFEMTSEDPSGSRVSIVEDPGIAKMRAALQHQIRLIVRAEQSDGVYTAIKRRAALPTRPMPDWYWIAMEREAQEEGGE